MTNNYSIISCENYLGNFGIVFDRRKQNFDEITTMRITDHVQFIHDDYADFIRLLGLDHSKIFRRPK